MENTKQKRDLYAEVTERIVQTLEKGIRPWSCPWTRSSTGGILPRRHTGEVLAPIQN
ncbi:ArdC-like ssDNA-binding domain-containing protein [Extensimonas perlucida]|jgi:antirestriction protein ArdC|uniref:ArdC-like ssDNA-binding domain-containing protein n=1 Tax=Extensimonas perlucida TaxID=2590786 RepID=UPI0011A5AF25|nr:ArdC-like ssDNA-binding domain-containing protein [Extensimonas perlucida]MBC7215300.1 DUF1738 domain-containing protein [Burkholderiaceae bacterium]